jgi:type IV pilus assembly protein PilM
MNLPFFKNKIMDLASLNNRFVKDEVEKFTAINLGNCYIKGLNVEAGKVEGYFLEKREDLAAAIKKLWAEKKISAKKIKVSVKDPSCLVRYFPFPKMDKKKLGQALFFEMNKFIPFPSDKVYFDFFVLGETSPTEAAVLLAVAKKDFINNILDIFGKFNLRVSEINLDSVCLVNLFLNNYEDNKNLNSCLLDIGYYFSTMTIINKGTPFLTRDVKFSAKEVFQIVSRIKNRPLPDIEKELFFSKDNGRFLNSTQDSILNFCKELKSSFDYFEVNRGEPVNRLYLSGGLASIKGIERVFAEALDIEVENLRPFAEKDEKLSQAFFNTEFNAFKNSFSVPFGLVL